jgi:hypothetical protein
VLRTKNIRSGQELVASTSGANNITAGGGYWAKWLGGTGGGVFTSWGLHLPNSWVQNTSMGPDGELAVKRVYHSFGPYDVRVPDGGSYSLTTGDAEYVQMFGAGRAIWTENGVPKARGVPLPTPLTRPYWWLRMTNSTKHGWWQLYQESGGKLLLQDDEGNGYVVTSGNTFGPDLVFISDDVIRVVWAISQGEPPQDVRVRDINVVTEAREDLGALPLVDVPGGLPGGGV